MSDMPVSNRELLEVKLPSDKKRFLLIGCEIFYRELCKLVSESEHVVDLRFLEKGLHDIATGEMTARIQKAIDQADDKYDAILLAYGRCNNGLVGLLATKTPLVIPRTHDCIGILFGSASAYADFFQNHPGTFYRSSGWTERDSVPEGSVMKQLGLDFTANELIDKYGQQDASYILETLGSWTDHYQNLAYIKTGLHIDDQYAELTRKEALEKGLNFLTIEGSLSLLKNLVNGIWPKEHFLTVPVGQHIIANDHGKILACE